MADGQRGAAPHRLAAAEAGIGEAETAAVLKTAQGTEESEVDGIGCGESKEVVGAGSERGH